MEEYRKFGLREIMTFLDDGLILERKHKSSKGNEVITYYRFRNNELQYKRETNHFQSAVIPFNNFLNYEFRIYKTIEEKITEVFEKYGFSLRLLRTECDHVCFSQNEEDEKLDIIGFTNEGLNFYTPSLNNPSFTFSLAFLTELYEIYRNNCYTFKEGE